MRSPLFVFPLRQFLQPLAEHEERLSFCVRLPSGETVGRALRARRKHGTRTSPILAKRSTNRAQKKSKRMNEKVAQALQKGKEIAVPLCIKGKELALTGYAKGNELMDKVSFLQKPLHKKIVWGMLGILVVMGVWTVVGGSDDYADPYKFVDMMVKEDMSARKDFYELNGISGYKILRAEEKEDEENVIECSVQFFADSGLKYYRRDNEMSYGELAETVWYDENMGKKAKDIVDQINVLKDKIRDIKIYGYQRVQISEFEKDMLSGGPIERRFINGKWRPRYHMKELTDGTYFLTNVSYAYGNVRTRKTAQDFENDTVAVFYDADGKIEEDSQRKAVDEYRDAIGNFKKLWWEWDKEFLPKGKKKLYDFP